MGLGRHRLSAPLIGALAAGLLFALFVTNLVTLGGIHSNRGWMIRARKAQSLLSDIRGALVDAETGQRGFLLTGRADDLQPLEGAATSVPSSLAALRELTADDLAQRGRVEEMAGLATTVIAELRTTIALSQRGDPAAALSLVRSDESRRLMDRARGLIAEMRVHEDTQLEQRTSRVRHRLDRAIWVDAIAGVGLLALGVVLFRINVDLARRQELERAQREEAMFQEQFIGILGHDLNNPLSAITIAAERLGRAGLSDRPAKMVEHIASSVSRMKRMVDQLRDLTRARLAGGIAVQPTPGTDLGEVVRATVEELRTAHPSAALVLRCDGIVHGTWDPDRMAQVASNLVANGIMHGAGPVEVRVRDAGTHATLQVHNGGPPIPSDLLPRIFEAFHRSAPDGTARPRGLGLGLFIAERIVAAHGGTIQVRSTEAEGTTFNVTLPVGRINATAEFPILDDEPDLSLGPARTHA
jgi:signal transduction histidine kinase